MEDGPDVADTLLQPGEEETIPLAAQGLRADQSGSSDKTQLSATAAAPYALQPRHPCDTPLVEPLHNPRTCPADSLDSEDSSCHPTNWIRLEREPKLIGLAVVVDVAAAVVEAFAGLAAFEERLAHEEEGLGHIQKDMPAWGEFSIVQPERLVCWRQILLLRLLFERLHRCSGRQLPLWHYHCGYSSWSFIIVPKSFSIEWN